MNQQEALYEFYKLKPMYRGVGATESILLTNCPRPVNVNNLLATATRTSDKLAVSGNYTRAYRTFYANHTEIEECEAVNNVLDREHHGDDITAESLEELFQVPSIRAMLPQSIKQQEQRAHQAEREGKIAELAEGDGTFYRYFDGTYGQFRRFPIAELHTVDDAELQRIYDLVMDQRRASGLTSDEKRKVLQQTAARPELPERYTTISGQVIRLTRSNMIRLLSKDDWRRLINNYGHDAVNERLGVKKVKV